MAYTSIKRRIKKIQSGGDERYLRILELIDQGAYFDELTPEEQALYKEYKESLGGVADDIAAARLDIMFLDTPEEVAFHFPLTRRRKPPTPEEHEQRVKEVREIFERIRQEEKQDEE